MGGRNYFFEPPRSIIHQYERCLLRSQQRMILIVIQNQYHYTQTFVVCLTTILNWVPLWGWGTHGKIPTLPTSHQWSDNRARDKLSYVLRPRLISVLHSQEDFPPELQVGSEGKHNKMESDKTRRCPITTSARSNPPTNKSIFSTILPLTVCRLWSLRVENCFNFNSVQNTTNTILRAFCNETNLSITSTQSNLFNELKLQRFVWAKERDGELSTAKTFLAIISFSREWCVCECQSIFNVEQQLSGYYKTWWMGLLDLTPNRFHQCNWRDVRSTDFTSDNQIPADQYIEKLQMWSWKLMDLYHKTNKRSRGRTETFGEDREQHKYRVIAYFSQKVKFCCCRNYFPWSPGKKSKIISLQRFLALQDSRYSLSVSRVFVLFWPSQFKFTDGSKSSGKYLVGQMTDWYWYYAPSHFSHKPLKFSSNISFVIKTIFRASVQIGQSHNKDHIFHHWKF